MSLHMSLPSGMSLRGRPSKSNQGSVRNRNFENFFSDFKQSNVSLKKSHNMLVLAIFKSFLLSSNGV